MFWRKHKDNPMPVECRELIEIEFESAETVKFVNVLGELGLRFNIKEEYFMNDSVNPKRKRHYRTALVIVNTRDVHRLATKLSDRGIYNRVV